MSEIYAQMFLADQRLSLDTRLHRIADTSRVYEAILASYGYTAEDYFASQEYYLRDGKRYAKLLKKSVEILEKENRVFKEEKSRLDAMQQARRGVLRFAPHRVFMLDSLDFGEADSCLLDFDFQAGMDTVFKGPRLLVASDSVALSDSLAFSDSLADAAL